MVTHSKQLDDALSNYFSMSPILRADLDFLLEKDNDSASWRRTFVRAGAAHIEGYIHCIKEMLVAVAPGFRGKGDNAWVRIRRTLGAAYSTFGLTPAPDFDCAEWKKAERLFKKRHALMHPKTPDDLKVDDVVWKDIYDGFLWLTGEIFAFFDFLQQKAAALRGAD